MHFMKVRSVNTLNQHLLTLKAYITTQSYVDRLLKYYEASLTNSVDLEQTAHLEQSDLGPHCLPLY